MNKAELCCTSVYPYACDKMATNLEKSGKSLKYMEQSVDVDFNINKAFFLENEKKPQIKYCLDSAYI
jgi:hypothetical protein